MGRNSEDSKYIVALRGIGTAEKQFFFSKLRNNFSVPWLAGHSFAVRVFLEHFCSDVKIFSVALRKKKCVEDFVRDHRNRKCIDVTTGERIDVRIHLYAGRCFRPPESRQTSPTSLLITFDRAKAGTGVYGAGRLLVDCVLLLESFAPSEAPNSSQPVPQPERGGSVEETGGLDLTRTTPLPTIRSPPKGERRIRYG